MAALRRFDRNGSIWAKQLFGWTCFLGSMTQRCFNNRPLPELDKNSPVMTHGGLLCYWFSEQESFREMTSLSYKFLFEAYWNFFDSLSLLMPQCEMSNQFRFMSALTTKYLWIEEAMIAETDLVFVWPSGVLHHRPNKKFIINFQGFKLYG